MTIAQLAVLRLVADREVSMFCDKCVWHHRISGTGETINRRTIEALERAGLVHRSYYRDGAGISLTEAGRQRIAQWDKNRRSAA